MRASAPIEVALNRSGLWRGALIGLAAASACVMAAWIVLSREQQTRVALVGAGVMTLVVVALASAGGRVGPALLRWDGLRWQLTERARSSHPPAVGDLHVAIDLCFWMLLRFAADAPGGRRRITWLPVQRRGLEAQWHGLRCAVYSPQAAPGLP